MCERTGIGFADGVMALVPSTVYGGGLGRGQSRERLGRVEPPKGAHAVGDSTKVCDDVCIHGDV